MTSVDALIITAVTDEMEEALEALKDRSKGPCEVRADDKGFEYHTTELTGLDGRPISVAVAQANSMGGEAAAHIATALVRELRPTFLGMCGLCAGWRDKVFLGDLVVAAESFRYDRGKRIGGRRGPTAWEDFKPDPQAFPISRTQYGLDTHRRNWQCSWSRQQRRVRPLSLEYQSRWLITRLYDSECGRAGSPQFHDRRALDCPDWTETLRYAQKRGWVLDTELVLSDDGIKEVNRLQREAITDLASDPTFQVHLDGMASGEVVSQDPELFSYLERMGRKTIAVEMESHAIYMVAKLEKVPHTLVVKAVMDYSDGFKDDRFQRWGAHVSALFLLDWITHIPLRQETSLVSNTIASHPVDRSGPGSSNVEAESAIQEASCFATVREAVRSSRPTAGGPYEAAHFVGRGQEAQAALDDFNQQQVAILWGPERFGKTWLLQFLLQKIREQQQDTQIVVLDDALWEKDGGEDAPTFYLWCAQSLARQAGIECTLTEQVPSTRFGLTDLEAFLRNTLLPSLSGPLVLVIDGAERWLKIPSAPDLFRSFRTWWQSRSSPPWNRFFQLLTVSTRPESLRQSLTNSLFAVVEPTQLSPLTLVQQGELGLMYGYASKEKELENLDLLVRGHPFLAAMAFQEAVRKNERLEAILQDAEHGLYRNHLARLRRQLDAAQVQYLDILRKLDKEPGTEIAVNLYDELLRAGLIRPQRRAGHNETAAAISCNLYRSLLTGQDFRR